MDRENQSVVTEFIFVGFSSFPYLHLPLFVLFTVMYLAILTGNVIIITTIKREPSLHIPMYFFLGVLSSSEIVYTFIIIPNMLANFLREKGTISFIGCAVQMCMFLGLGCTNCMLLTVMGYDRYVCICKPLRYPVLMSQRLCTTLVICSVCLGFFFSTVETVSVFTLPFCGPNEIHHFFCDISPVMKLACAQNYISEIVIFLISILVVLCCFILILLSYLLIVNTVLKIPTTEGKRKAFSTCAAHLIVVVVHFGCISIIYLRPQYRYTMNVDTLIAVTYTLITPMLNPVVYSLRNKDVQVALKKYLGKSTFSQKM